MDQDRFIWDATAIFEALAAADVVLWTWEPERDRMRVTGAARKLGLGPLAPECSSAAMLALALPQDRALVEEFLRSQEPGCEMSARIRMRGGESCIWRGVWLEEGGVRASGVVAPESKFAASETDELTGLLDRKSFIHRARDHLQTEVPFELMIADLNRLRRLNEALGHERADLVLSALGSRLMAAFPRDALLARVGEDEFAILAPDVGRPPADVAAWRARDPIVVAETNLRAHPQFNAGLLDTWRTEIATEVAAAFDFARTTPWPDVATRGDYVYA